MMMSLQLCRLSLGVSMAHRSKRRLAWMRGWPGSRRMKPQDTCHETTTVLAFQDRGREGGCCNA